MSRTRKCRLMILWTDRLVYKYNLVTSQVLYTSKLCVWNFAIMFTEFVAPAMLINNTKSDNCVMSKDGYRWETELVLSKLCCISGKFELFISVYVFFISDCLYQYIKPGTWWPHFTSGIWIFAFSHLIEWTPIRYNH